MINFKIIYTPDLEIRKDLITRIPSIENFIADKFDRNDILIIVDKFDSVSVSEDGILAISPDNLQNFWSEINFVFEEISQGKEIKEVLSNFLNKITGK